VFASEVTVKADELHALCAAWPLVGVAAARTSARQGCRPDDATSSVPRHRPR